MNYKRLGDYIREVDERNQDLLITTLLGLSINKEFIPSVANIIGTDMTKYKIIRKHQFACSTMQVRRDGKMPIALMKQEEAIISQAYPVFEVIDQEKLLPDYLMMWFSRPEFDREACFYAVGGVRGSIEWEDFLNMQLPIPSIEKQREIVAEYNALQKRIDLNNQLIQKLEETAQTIYKQWFVDFEFPDENGNPYKSSGGEMIDSELGEIPKGWKVERFTNIVKLSGGGTPDTNNELFWNGDISFFTPADISNNVFCISTEKYITNLGLEKSSTKLYPQNTVFISARGTVGGLAIAGCSMAMNQSCYALTGNNPYFIHQTTSRLIEKLKKEALGAVFSALVTKDFNEQRVVYSGIVIENEYQKSVQNIYANILNLTKEIFLLGNIKDLLLSKMSTN